MPETEKVNVPPVRIVSLRNLDLLWNRYSSYTKWISSSLGQSFANLLIDHSNWFRFVNEEENLPRNNLNCVHPYPRESEVFSIEVNHQLIKDGRSNHLRTFLDVLWTDRWDIQWFVHHLFSKRIRSSRKKKQRSFPNESEWGHSRSSMSGAIDRFIVQINRPKTSEMTFVLSQWCLIINRC